MKKLLFCRPRGGINDILVQIERCWGYCNRHDRSLVVDGSRSGFLDNLANYFVSNELEFSQIHPDKNKSCSPAPPEIAGYDYASVYNTTIRNFTFAETNQRISFEFDKNYEHEVLLHEQCGGGRESIDALKKLQLKPEIRNSIKKVIESIGSYVAIHVRNTDYKTDYKSFFNSIQPDEKTIVLCSDDYECQEYAKSIWGSRLIIPNPAPKTNGKPLHMNGTLGRFATNCATLSDLVLLASAKKLHYTKISLGFLSGFTQLALDLKGEPETLEQLLGYAE